MPHSQRYYSPAFARPGATPLEGWYAFRMGPVHFVILDSEAPTHPGSAMHRWGRGGARQGFRGEVGVAC